MIENRPLVYVGDFGRPPSTGRALKNVPIAASTPFQGRGEQCNDFEKGDMLVAQ